MRFDLWEYLMFDEPMTLRKL